MFTLLDIIILIIVVLSGILAMIRGFTREFLFLAAILIGLGAAFVFFKPLAPIAESYIQPAIVARVILTAGVFLIVFIVFSLMTRQLPNLIVDSSFSALDRTLGFVFGILRGILLIVVLMIPVNMVFSSEALPDWVSTSKSAPLLKAGGDKILALLPGNTLEWLQTFFNASEPANQTATPPNNAIPDPGDVPATETDTNR